jgi:hypothetical protein
MKKLILFLNKLFKRTKYQKKIKTIDIEGLSKRMSDNSYSKNYRNYKKTYRYGNRGSYLLENQRKFNERGKCVKCWILVKSAFDYADDEYIPVFYKQRKGEIISHPPSHPHLLAHPLSLSPILVFSYEQLNIFL